MTFEVGRKYYDAIGRKWKVIASVYDSEGNIVLAVRRWDKGVCIAFEEYDGVATVLFKEGFTTIYEKEEEE